MALNDTKIAVYWVGPNGVKHSKIYKNLDQAQHAKKWLIEQGLSVGDIELAVVKEIINEPEPIAQ